MPNIVPGAAWSPIQIDDPARKVFRAPRQQGRGAIAHVAVSESLKLLPGPLATRPSDWTFYLPKEPIDGEHRFWQLIDFDLQCWSSAAGNATCPAWESQGGVVDPDGEPWTDNQLEAAASIYAYGMETEGWPAQLMPDSRPPSRGLGYHRLGIDPWRVAGGELWSSSRGKLCPGAAKIAQLPVILGRAVELTHGSPSPAPQPPPAPAPAPVPPPRLVWPFGRGQYVGDINGPAASHGGFYAGERPFIQNVQQWLIYHGCVPGQTDWRSGWADGRFQRPYSTDAAARWHARFYAGQPFPDQIWADDYDRLARP